MDFLIKNTKGLTLKTKGKYCTEDLVIEIDPSLVEGYMEIDELPEVGLPRVLYKLMLEEPEYYIWENDEWLKLNTKGGGGSATVTRELTGGEPIPNTGTLSEIYLNTDLTIEEVVEVLSQLTYGEDGFNYVAIANDMSFQFGVAMMDGMCMIGEMISQTIYFVNEDIGLGFAGWNTSLIVDKKITLPSEITLTSELNGKVVGTQNDILSSVVSVSEFKSTFETLELSGEYAALNNVVLNGNDEVDIKELIVTEKKIPLKVTSKIPFGYIQPSGELEITTPGTYDVTEYEQVKVNIKIPYGRLDITENGQYDITDYHLAYVAVGYNLDETETNKGGLAYMTEIADYAYISMPIRNVKLTNVTKVGKYAFSDGNHLRKVDLGSVTYIGKYAFTNNTHLEAIIIRTTTQVAVLENNNALSNTNSCPIYVPDSLVDSYKDEWNFYESRIKPLSEYVEE